MAFPISTGQKCPETGVYNPQPKRGKHVNLIIFKDETFPSYYDGSETGWSKTGDLFTQCQIEHARSVLREHAQRIFGGTPN